jgi:hypothetical protein
MTVGERQGEWTGGLGGGGGGELRWELGCGGAVDGSTLIRNECELASVGKCLSRPSPGM